jgi:hypothetical protein
MNVFETSVQQIAMLTTSTPEPLSLCKLLRMSLVVTSLASAGSAHAATLSADALLCESVDSIAFVKRTPNLADRPAANVIALAKLQLQFIAMQKETALMFRSNATHEAAIARERYARPADRTAQEFQAYADRASAEVEPYSAVAQTCAASGNSVLQVAIVEKRAISGVAKVKLTFNGQPAVLWTMTASVAE